MNGQFSGGRYTRLVTTTAKFCLAAALLPIAAHASLIGQSGTVEYDYPAVGQVYSMSGGPFAFTVSAVVLTESDPGFKFVQNTIGPSGIDIAFLQTSQFGPTTFNGEVFMFPNVIINGVTVTQNMGAVVTFDATHIYANFQGLSFCKDDTFVNIAVDAGDPAPEPASSASLGAGLAALLAAGAVKRRMNTKRAMCV